MIINNETKKLSRNRKRRITRKLNISNDMKSILNKIKSEKKKKNRNIDKITQLKIQLVSIRYANDLKKLNNALKN